jgi:hypothetical protein
MNNWPDIKEDEINHESFVFYDSFYIAMKHLSADEKAEYIGAICDYALYEKTSDLSPKIESMFQLIKPQLDANLRKRKNGKLGGRPRINKSEVLSSIT